MGGKNGHYKLQELNAIIEHGMLFSHLLVALHLFSYFYAGLVIML